MSTQIRITIETQDSGRIVEARFFFDDCQVYAERSLYLSNALVKLVTTASQLTRLPFLLNGRKSIETDLLGRKVYWRELPAVVHGFDGRQGKVELIPEPPEHEFPSEPWDMELGGGKVMSHGAIREDLLSPKIYWYRETDAPKLPFACHEENNRAVLGPEDVPIYDAEVKLAFFKEQGQQADFQAVLEHDLTGADSGARHIDERRTKESHSETGKRAAFRSLRRS